MGTSNDSDTSSIASTLPCLTCLSEPELLLQRRKPIILLGTALTFLFSTLQVSECSFFRTGSRTELGLFRRGSYDRDGVKLGCVAYEEQDGMLQSSRAFGVLTVVLTCLCLGAVSISLLFRPKLTPRLWKISLGLAMAATLTQTLSFLVLGSAYCTLNHCSLSGVGILAVFSTLLLVCLSVLLFIEEKPNRPWLIVWNEKYFGLNYDTTPTSASIPTGSRDTNSYPSLQAVPEKKTEDRKARFAPVITFMDDVEEQSEPEICFSDSNSINSKAGLGNIDWMTVSKRMSFRLGFVLLVVSSWCISLVINQRCTFMMVGLRETPREFHSGFGLYSRAVYSEERLIGCIAFNLDQEESESFDGPYRAGRAFGALTSLLLTIATLLTGGQLFTQFWCDEVWWVLRGLLSSSILTQVLVFWAFSSNVCSTSSQTQCLMGGASVMALLNVLLLVALTGVAFILRAPSNPIFLWYTKENRAKIQAGPQQCPLERKLSSLPDGSVEDATDNSADSDKLSEQQQQKERAYEESVQKYLKGRALPASHYPRAPDDAQQISVRIEYSADNTERKTIKEITHPDGSKTITTTIEELDDDDDEHTEYEESVCDVNSIASGKGGSASPFDQSKSLLSTDNDGNESIEGDNDEVDEVEAGPLSNRVSQYNSSRLYSKSTTGLSPGPMPNRPNSLKRISEEPATPHKRYVPSWLPRTPSTNSLPGTSKKSYDSIVNSSTPSSSNIADVDDENSDNDVVHMSVMDKIRKFEGKAPAKKTPEIDMSEIDKYIAENS